MNIELFITIIAALLVARVLAPLANRVSAILFGIPQQVSISHSSATGSTSGAKMSARGPGQ